MPTIPETQEVFILPKAQSCNSAAQTPKEQNARLLKHATENKVAYVSCERGGTLAPLVLTKTNYPELAIFDTAVKGYIFLDIRAANSGMNNETP